MAYIRGCKCCCLSGYITDELVLRGLIGDASVPLLLKPFTPGEMVEPLRALREAGGEGVTIS